MSKIMAQSKQEGWRKWLTDYILIPLIAAVLGTLTIVALEGKFSFWTPLAIVGAVYLLYLLPGGKN